LADFLTQQAATPVVRQLLRKLEYVFVPVANPDGYELTWFRYPIYRFWRKNLAYFGPDLCGGVDLNRNFRNFWTPTGEYCSNTFPGLSPHSEPEVQAISRYISSIKAVVASIDFHSYQQLVLTPYSGSSSKPPNHKRVMNVAKRIARTISQTNSKNYTSLRGSELYTANGTFTDWMYSEEVFSNNTDSSGHAYRIFPLSIELRPRRPNTQLTLDGFLVPQQEVGLLTCVWSYCM
jgi:hypothetical protein